MPSVKGVLETALYVEDLERAAKFYSLILKFEKLLSTEKYCALSVAGRQILMLFKKGASLQPAVVTGGAIPATDGQGNLHLAFAIGMSEVEEWESWLHLNGVTIESKVNWKRGGHSLYFRDPDRNCIELITPGCWSIY
ncbi:MAG: VOC family protein [bacterium]